jgi:C1A family cysteine protease
MFDPDPRNRFIEPDGDHAGGHAYLVVGINLKANKVKILNSWGSAWGLNGCAWMKLDQFWGLMEDGGEGLAVSDVPNFGVR